MLPEQYENCDVVWLTELNRFAFVVDRGAHFVVVEWLEEPGVVITEAVPYGEYETWEERAIEFDTDAD